MQFRKKIQQVIQRLFSTQKTELTLKIVLFYEFQVVFTVSVFVGNPVDIKFQKGYKICFLTVMICWTAGLKNIWTFLLFFIFYIFRTAKHIESISEHNQSKAIYLAIFWKG